MNTEFEDFLFAPVGEQENGMSVSMFSALARLDIDPWREAKRLSELPKERAIQALRGSIDRLADLQWTAIDAAGIAARLIRLLPSHGGQAQPSGNTEGEARLRRPQPVTPATLLSKASNLPMSTWLVIGAVIMVAMYFMWSGGNTSQSQNQSPSSYDNPVREKPKR